MKRRLEWAICTSYVPPNTLPPGEQRPYEVRITASLTNEAKGKHDRCRAEGRGATSKP